MLGFKLIITDFSELEGIFRLSILTSHQCKKSYTSGVTAGSQKVFDSISEKQTSLTMKLSLLTFPFSDFSLLELLFSDHYSPKSPLFGWSVFLDDDQKQCLAKNHWQF